MTITALFTLAGLLPFTLAIAITDSYRACAREARETEKAFGFDTKIFPDYLNTEH